MKTTNRIKQWWCDHDRRIAQNQLSHYGVIFLDQKGYPVEDKYLLEELLESYRHFTGGTII